MCYWVLILSGKVVTQTTVKHVTRTNLLDSDMKGQIEKFDEELEKVLDDTNFFDDVRFDYYINDVDEADEESHGGGSNTPINEAYGDMMV